MVSVAPLFSPSSYLFFSQPSFPTSAIDINIKYASECFVIHAAASLPPPSLSLSSTLSRSQECVTLCGLYNVCINGGQMSLFVHSNTGLNRRQVCTARCFCQLLLLSGKLFDDFSVGILCCRVNVLFSAERNTKW